MAFYTFRCPDHGDFPAEQSMTSTTRTFPCGTCSSPSPKVLGARMQFTGGRRVFHDGVEGTGETGREVRDRWISEFTERNGYAPEPAGSRWV